MCIFVSNMCAFLIFSFFSIGILYGDSAFSLWILYGIPMEHSSIFLLFSTFLLFSFRIFSVYFIRNSHGNWSLNTPHFCISIYFPMEKLRNPEVREGPKPVGVRTNNQGGRESGPCRLCGGYDKARHIVPTALLVRV